MLGSGLGVPAASTLDGTPSRTPWYQRELPRWIRTAFVALAYAFGILYFGLMGLGSLVAPAAQYRWIVLLGPVLSFALIAALPPFRGESLGCRAHFLLMVAFAVPFANHAATLLARALDPSSEQLALALAGPREEALKLLAVFFLAWSTRRAAGWPSRLVALGFAVGIAFSGIESASLAKLPTLHERAVFNRILANADHGLCTGVAVSGFAMVPYLRSRWRLLIPLGTFVLGASFHAIHNTQLKLIHGHLLRAVNDLPDVMTSEQWFNAPHYGTIHYGVSLGYALLVALILAALIATTFRLARRSGWTPQSVEPSR